MFDFQGANGPAWSYQPESVMLTCQTCAHYFVIQLGFTMYGEPLPRECNACVRKKESPDGE